MTWHRAGLLGVLLLVGALLGTPPAAGASTAPCARTKSGAAPALRLLVEPGAGMERIDTLLADAKHSVDLEMYELADPRIEAILAADAARGVRVRVILDRAAIAEQNAPAFEYLTAHHVAVRWAPAQFDLDHEKAAVIDAATALVMTMNFAAPYYKTTRDVVVIDDQAADLRAIEDVFATDWSGVASSAPTGRDLLWSPNSEQAMLRLIGSARHDLLVENEEMGDADVTDALAAAARRGVDVTVAMTADARWDRSFAALATDGVHVRLSPTTESALYIHAKIVVVDAGDADGRAFVGSENFSVASLVYNRELGIVTSVRPVVATLAGVVAHDARRGRSFLP